MSLKKFQSKYGWLNQARQDDSEVEVREAKGKSSQELDIYDRHGIEENLKYLRLSIIGNDEKGKEREGNPDFKFLAELKAEFPECGVYLVGGSVRDAVIGKEPKDFDLVVNHIDPVDLLKVLLKYGKVTFDKNPKADVAIMSDSDRGKLFKQSYGVIKYDPNNRQSKELIDIAFPREDDYSKSGQFGIRGIKRDIEAQTDPELDIKKDLERRDLTINAIAINLMKSEIIDPYDGIDDLVKGKIRAVGNPQERILLEDFSRGLRAIRFACVFNADIEKETKKATKEIFKPSQQTAEHIYRHDSGILAEVKRYEKEVRKLFKRPEGQLSKCLQVFFDREQRRPRMALDQTVMSSEFLKATNADPKKFIELLDELGGLEVLLPEVTALKGVEQPRDKHREGDVFVHTLMVLGNLPSNSSLRLKLAALFHDLGKPEAQEKHDGKITFHGHEEKSIGLVDDIAKRLRLGRKLVDDVKFLVKHHSLSLSKDIMEIKATKLEKIFLEDIELGKDLIELCRADSQSAISENGSVRLETVDLLVKRLEDIKSRAEDASKSKIKPFVNGNDLIAMGYQEGRVMGDVLKRIKEAQLRGEINSREEALEYIKNIKKE